MTANQTPGNLVKVQLAALLAGTAALFAFAPGVARAVVVVPNVLINSYSTSYGQREPSHSVNGGGTEDSQNPNDNWMTAFNPSANGDIGWTLNGKYALSSINVYNYREFNNAARSAKDIVMSISSDWGKTYSVFSTSTLLQAPTTGTNTPTTFAFSGQSVTNVKIHINNAYSNTENYVGLNEVQFNGTAARATAIAPITVTGQSSQYIAGADQRLGIYAADGLSETVNSQQMWMGTTTTPQITFSLGANPQIIDHLNIWNYNEFNLPNRGMKDIQIRLLGPGGSDLGLAVNDADGSTVFTLNKNSSKFYDFVGNGAADGNSVADTLGIRNAVSAYGFRIEGINNQGDSSFAGLTEVQAFVAPEPASLGLLAVGATLLLRKRRA